jgi:hypothetical protein
MGDRIRNGRPGRSLWLVVFVVLSLAAFAAAGPGSAAENSAVGAGNELAVDTSDKSALVLSAKRYILARAGEIRDGKLRTATLDAIDNPQTCIRHRIGLDDAAKTRIMASLAAEGLVDPEDDAKFPGGVMAGVFPPVREAGGDCPMLPQTYNSAPGSSFGGHHSYPGGLPIHEAFNLSSAISLADNYRRTYGHSNQSGLPEVTPVGIVPPSPDAAEIMIDQDIIIAAPIWHDWAKTIVFQWTAGGSEFPELNFGGNGKTDSYGGAGDSKTGGHHLIGLAETIKRGLPPAFVAAQASAHDAPTGTQEYKVVNWIRTGAIIAQVDPLAGGYLIRDDLGRLRLPPVRQLGSVSIQKVLPNEPNLLVEYVLHNLSDADYTYTGPAVAEAQILLRMLAQRFGYDINDTATFNTKFRNPVLSTFSAERLQIIYAAKGIDGVAGELEKLKRAGMI